MPLKMTTRFNTKNFIAEQKRLFAAVERGQRRGLMRGGGYVRRVARNSIRKGGKRKNRVSNPGDPIRWHTRPGIKDNIYFAYDQRDGVVPVGPIKFAGSDVPETLEHGGKVEIRRHVYRNGQRVIERSVVHIDRRPTMGNALDASQDKLAEFFKDVVR